MSAIHAPRLADRVALVTGAGRGIGRATAVTLAAHGADIIVNDLDEAGAHATAEAVRAAGRRALVAVVDVADRTAAQDLVARGEAELGAIDIAVNNAGITRDALLARMAVDQWDEVLATNLSGPFHVGQACARGMIARRRGRLINVASLAWLGNIGQSNYAAAKAGLVGLTRTWALELGRHGVTVNAVAPGFIATPMTQAVPEPTREKFIRKIPLQRIGQPEDVARVIAFLASDDAAYVSGQCIHVDGALGTGIGGLF